ncbi:hypothetical protein [Streptomyces sp. NBC_01506]|uniref:hypothetical protein n=1 Tax=Streptomyces sp. NBC_01506 TaxID=2903887 RepID=UPI003864612E
MNSERKEPPLPVRDPRGSLLKLAESRRMYLVPSGLPPVESPQPPAEERNT